MLYLKGRKRHKGKVEKQKCEVSHGRCLPLPCRAHLNTVPTHHMSRCTWLFSNRWQKSREEENVLLCNMFFFWYTEFCSCQSRGWFSIYYYKCIWGKSLVQLSVPLIVYFNTSVIVLFFLNLMKWWIFSGVFSLSSSVGKEVLSQWRFRSHLEIQPVSTILFQLFSAFLAGEWNI